jgi:hypothetical protein
MQPQDANGNAHSCVSVVFTPGAVAAGLSVILEVEICADEVGAIEAEAAVETETETFLIPISAVVLSAATYAEWEAQGGQIPCNVTAVDQAPKRMVRSKAPVIATMRKQLAAKKEMQATSKGGGMGSSKLHDLQDPVPEPQVPGGLATGLDVDWHVDETRNLMEIKEMTAKERLRERKIQELKRRGRPINEATLSGIDAELRAIFPVPKRDRNTKSPLQNIQARADEEQVATLASVQQEGDKSSVEEALVPEA